MLVTVYKHNANKAAQVHKSSVKDAALSGDSFQYSSNILHKNTTCLNEMKLDIHCLRI